MTTRKENKWVIIQNCRTMTCDSPSLWWAHPWSTKSRCPRALMSNNKIDSVCWNYNSIIWSSPSTFQDVISLWDLIFLIETHDSPKLALPTITSYYWISTFKQDTRRSWDVHRLRRVACLIRDHFWSQVSLLASNTLTIHVVLGS